MGAASSTSSRSQLEPLESGEAKYRSAFDPPWPLPSASQDDTWLKVNLPMLVGPGAGLTGKVGKNFGGASSERRGDGNMRETQAVRSLQSCPGSVRYDDENGDWLEASLCLSMASLQTEEMALLVARVKEKLFKTLSCLCYQDDAFCEAVTQQIHTLRCVHAAMSRQRRAQHERGGKDAPRQQKKIPTGENRLKATGRIGFSCVASGDDILGLQLFFSMLDFVRDPECGQEQLTDFLEQISPVLSSLPPLCLAGESSEITDGIQGKQGARRNASPGVVYSLREFLVALALPGQNHDGSIQVGSERKGHIGRPKAVPDNEQRKCALSAIISLVAARGRASDLLVLVKVLLSASYQKLDAAKVFQGDGAINLPGATELRKVVAECSAKRRPTSRVKARTSRQGLPVDDDDEDREAHDSPILSHAVITVAVGPANLTTGSSATDEPWNSVTRAHISDGTDGGRSTEINFIKGRKPKAERARLITPVNHQSWRNDERSSNQHSTLDLPSDISVAADESDGIEAKYILPFLRQLQAATPNGDQQLGKIRLLQRQEVWTCGQNSYGELGHNDTGTRKVHCLVEAFEDKEVVDVAAGNEHTVLLCRTGEVFTAGYNDNGQCGQGTTQRVGVLTRVPILAGSRAIQVHAYNGCEHTLVVLDDGRVVSFGYNYRGQLGHGNTTSEPIPKSIRGLDGIRVTQIYTFGRNDFGQLGSGDTIDRKLPSLVDSLRGQRVTSLACGQYHTVVSTSEIGVQSCGKNDYGQLGVESTESQKNFVVVKGALDGTKIRHLRCGYYHTIVLAAGGHVFGFGRNDYGQLGLGHTMQRVFGPKEIDSIEGKGICRVSAGCYHTVLIGSDGMLYVFGRNHHGQLGTGDTSERHSPFPVDTFLGKRVAKVAAGFYHTIVLTGGGDEETSEQDLGEVAHKLSPQNIITYPALILPQYLGVNSGAVSEVESESTACTNKSISPEMGSPLCDKESSSLPRGSTIFGFDQTKERKKRRENGRGICLSDGRISGRKAAVFIMAHMDRLAENFALPKGGVPVVGNLETESAEDDAYWHKKEKEGESNHLEGIKSRNLYCIDVSPDTFELLAAILVSVSTEDHFDDLGGGAHFRTYMVLATLRVLKANLTRLLQSDISTQIIASMVTRTTSLNLDDANELQLQGCIGHDSVLDAMLIYSSNDRLSSRPIGGEGKTNSTTCTEYSGEQGQNTMLEEGDGDADLGSDVERYRDVLCALKRRLLLLVHSEPSYDNGVDSGIGPIQKEAAAALILGLELFFSSQAEKFCLLSKLIKTALIGEDDDRGISVGEEFDIVNQPVSGSSTAHYLILIPLLKRLCNDGLASKLIPYGADVDKGSSVCTVVDVWEPALQGYTVVAASARLLEMQVKFLVDLIAQGDVCVILSEEAFVGNARTATSLHRYQEDNPLSVPQLNGSSPHHAESFGLGANTSSNSAGDGVDDPVPTQRLIVDLVLTLTKHMMHWAASDRVKVDPVLWQSRVLGSVGIAGGETRRICPDNSGSAEAAEWFASRIKGLCDRAASVILDGVDRTPSSWRCLIKHAQQVLKYCNATLEADFEKESEEQSEIETDAETAETTTDGRLLNTLVGLLLPAVVTGLLPFAHVPVFARRLLDVVNIAVGLLDKACCTCPSICLADADYIASRNGFGETLTKKKTQQALFIRGESGKLGGGQAAAEEGVGSNGTAGGKYDSQDLPWLLSLAKTTALLAGRLATTLLVGDCGISPFLESYFRSPIYASWLESELLAGGFDASYERLVLAPLDIFSDDGNTNPEVAEMCKPICTALAPGNIKRSREKIPGFLEEVTGGYGCGGRFAVWLRDVLAPSGAAYWVIKRQAAAGRDGEALGRAERALLAAMLKHGGLEGDAALISDRLECQGSESAGKRPGDPPRRFKDLWKSTAEMVSWLWHSRSKLKSADADQSEIDALFEEAVDSCLVLMLFRSAGAVPPTLMLQQQSASCTSCSAEKLAAYRRWRKVVAVVRATIRWRATACGRILKQSVAAVPRFVRNMLSRRLNRSGLRMTLNDSGDIDQQKVSAGCLPVLLILVLDNHQRAVARASGLESLCTLVKIVRTLSLRAEFLSPLVRAMQTPLLVDRHILTHLSAVGHGITFGVTGAFQALLRELLSIIKDSCRLQEGEVQKEGSATNEKVVTTSGKSQTRPYSSPRCFDARTVLILLDIFGLTIHPEDWGFIEIASVIEIISLIADLQFATDGYGAVKHNVRTDMKVCGDTPKEEAVSPRKFCVLQSLRDAALSEQGHRLLSTCHAAARTLIRALIIQLHGTTPAPHTKSVYRGGVQEVSSTMEVLRKGLANCVSEALSKGIVASGEPRRGGRRGSGACSQHRDRTPSQAILEFATPLIGGFPDSPPHARAMAEGRVYGTGSSHKRRCQELVSSPRRLMNMEDGLVFPAEHVLSNPRGSDFSITFWLLLAQDRTGHHRTVLARGHGSERWPVVLLRNTDNRLEVCFGIPSMGNLCERLTSKEPIQVHRWTHVGLISEHNKLRLYFNGALDCQRTSTGALRANKHPLYVGKLPDGAMRLDGVRGGVEGSIASLRYFTRALSPIHVRIICDPGPPETAKVEDRHCFHLCACLVTISRSPQCRRHLQHPNWLRLLLQVFMYGTIRVQQAVCRLLQEILPHVPPQVMASVVLGATDSHAAQKKIHNDKEEPTSQTAFTAYLLRLVGATSWYVGSTISAVDGAAALPEEGDSEEESEMTLAQVLLTEQVMRFLPLTIIPMYTRRSQTGEKRLDVTNEPKGGFTTKTAASKTVAAHLSAPTLSAETAHGISTLGAELVALIQTLAATEGWGKAVVLALQQCLSDLMSFIDNTGGLNFPNPPGSHGVERNFITAEERLAIAGGEAVLHVLGGTIGFLRAGVCARVSETDQMCTVLSVDQATSTAHVISHPEGGAALEKWFQRFGTHELELEDSNSLSHSAMVAFSGNSTGTAAPCEGGVPAGSNFVMSLATAFLRSSPLPRLPPTSDTGLMNLKTMAYREIVLAQCRSRLARAILRTSQDTEWAISAVQSPDLLAQLLRVSILPCPPANEVIGGESIAKAETIVIQNRLRQMLSAPGGWHIVAGKITDMVLHPGRTTFSKKRGCDGGSGNDRRGGWSGRTHKLASPSTERTWIDTLICPFCHEEKSTVSGIIEHVLTKHSTDLRRVPCPLCVADKGDDTAHDLPTHLELVHFDAVLRDSRPLTPVFRERRRGSGVAMHDTRPPSHMVDQLMVIGFPEDWCTMALRENDNDVVNASAWIVDNLDMLSSLNNLEDSSADPMDQPDDMPSSIRHENGQPWQSPCRFVRQRLARREGREMGDNNRAIEEQQEEFQDGGGEGEEKYCEREPLDGDISEECNEEEGESEADQEDEEGMCEEDEDEDEEEDEEEDVDGGEDREGDEEIQQDRQGDEAFDSEEEDEEEEEDDEELDDDRQSSLRNIKNPQRTIAIPLPRSALDDALDDEQQEMAVNRKTVDGLSVSDKRENYFPLERVVMRTPGGSPQSRSDGSSMHFQLAAINSEIAGMELCQLTEVWLHTELQLTNMYCRAALVNVLLRWPQEIPLSTSSLGSSATVVKLVQSLLFRGQDLPVTFADDDTRGDILRPVLSGARPPNVLGMFAPLLVHFLISERDSQCSMGTSAASGIETVANEVSLVEKAGRQVGTIDEHGGWRNTLSTRLVSASLDDLDAAAAVEPFVEVSGDSATLPLESQRLLAEGKSNLELLQWLLDLLLSINCADILTENVFSRLSNCLNSPNVEAKEVAMYMLTSIATKWCEHLTIDGGHGCGDATDSALGPVSMPSPLAMEDTFQRHMALSRVRSALVKRIAVERRPGGLFFTRYTQTLTALYVAMYKLQSLLLCRRRQSSCNEVLERSDSTSEVNIPTILYCTDSSVALTWPPLSMASPVSTVLYEVNMATRQLGIVESQEVFRCVYAGKRLRCKVDDLMPGQVYRFRLRAVHLTAKPTAWSAVATAETEQGIAFRFDSANSGPSIFVSGSELSATFGSNETWSTILGTIPFFTGSNYWELHVDTSTTAYLFIGVANRGADLTTFLGGDCNGWGFIGDRAIYHKRTKVKAYGERFGQGDTIGVTLNMDRGTLSFSKNGQDLGVAFEGLTGGLYPAVAFYNQEQRLSLVQSAFRCPGAGVAVLESPLSTTPEDVTTIYEVMEAMVSRKNLPPAWVEVVRTEHAAWIAGKTTRYLTTLGFELQFDVSDPSCRQFGLKARGRVSTPRGNATVIGICEGVMWFHVDGERGAWFFTAGEIWEGRTVGCFVMSSSDVLGADGNGGWKQWRSPRGGVREQQDRSKGTRVNYAQEEGNQDSNLGNSTAGPSGGYFFEVQNCAQWTPDVDGCIVAALCDHADRHQVSVWNFTPAGVLDILSPVRRRLELLLASENTSDHHMLCRFSVLKRFNHEMVGVLPFADLAEGVQVSGQTESRTFCWGGPSRYRGLAVGVGGRPARGLGPLLVFLRRSIFLATKQQTFSQAVANTTTHAKKADDEYDYPEDLPQVTVNRLKAAAGHESPHVNTRLRTSVFYQLYRELKSVDTSLLRMGYTHPMDDGQQRTFKVKFEGEGVDDYGGPYREIFTQVAAELTSTFSSAVLDRAEKTQSKSPPEGDKCLLPILEPAQSWSSGGTRDEGVDFTVKADVYQRHHFRMYKFMGQLMGIALRCRVAAPWRLSPVFWKGIVGEELQEVDLVDIDSAVHAFVQGTRQRIVASRQTGRGDDDDDDDPAIAKIKGDTAEMFFAGAPDGLRWKASVRREAQELRLKRRGTAVTQSDLLLHVHEIAQSTLHKSDMAMFAVRDGFASVIPSAILPLFTWHEMELQACGRPGMDIDLLQANTEYDDDIFSSDQHIKSFWRVLRAFDDRDRSQFLRFVWARSRLPSKAVDFHQKFKIHSPTGEGARQDPDQYLPKAHTCFFSINLPRYSSDAIMAKKLTYTMYNCIEMDADFRLADNEMHGWGNDANVRNSRGQSRGHSTHFAELV